MTVCVENALIIFLLSVSAARPCFVSQSADAHKFAGTVSMEDSWAEIQDHVSSMDEESNIARISFEVFPEKTSGILFCSVDKLKDTNYSEADFLCVYLTDTGHLRLHISFPSLYYMIERELGVAVSKKSLRIDVIYSNEFNVTFTVDGGLSAFEAYSSLHSLQNRGRFYLGGLPKEYITPTRYNPITSYRSRTWPGGFEGCISIPNITYANGTLTTLQVANSSAWSGKTCSLENDCSPLDPDSCLNGGECVKNFHGKWQCDCRRTNFTGISCKETAFILPLRGIQGFILEYTPPGDPYIFDVSLHFKSRQTSGFIFQLKDTCNHSKVELLLEENQLTLQVKIEGSQEGSLYSILHHRSLQSDQWYFVRASSNKTTLALQLDDRIVTTQAPALLNLFSSSKLTVGDTDVAGAENAFEGCIKNINTGLQLLTDVSILNHTSCPGPDEFTPRPIEPTTAERSYYFDYDNSYIIKHPHFVSRIRFGLYSNHEPGLIIAGYHDDVLAFTLAMCSDVLFVEWYDMLKLLKEWATFEFSGSYLRTNITLVSNSTHYTLLIGEKLLFHSEQAHGMLRQVNKLIFGGSAESKIGFVENPLVNGYSPTVGIRVSHHYDEVSSARVPMHPNIQPCSTQDIIMTTESSTEMHSSSSHVITINTSESSILSPSVSPVPPQPTTTRPSSMEISDIILVSVVGFLCVALLVVVTIVIIFFTRHCCQFLTTQTSDCHCSPTKDSLPEIEKNCDKMYA